MVPLYTNILLQILTISKYPDNKEHFVKQFEDLNFDDALYNILDRLSYDKQEQVRACQGDLSKIQQFFTPEEYKDELCQVYVDALIEFIKSLAPSLNQQQKDQIAALFSQEQFQQQEIYNSLSL